MLMGIIPEINSKSNIYEIIMISIVVFIYLLYYYKILFMMKDAFLKNFLVATRFSLYTFILSSYTGVNIF